MKQQTYKPGEHVRSLYYIKPAITCPICNKSAKVNVHHRLIDQEGGNLSTTHLKLYQMSSRGQMTLKCYSIDIFTGIISVSIAIGRGPVIQVVPAHELPPIITVNFQYCLDEKQTVAATLPHYFETFILEINRGKAVVTDIVFSKFGMNKRTNDQYSSVVVDSTHTEFWVVSEDMISSRPIRTTQRSVERAAELIKSNRYLNLK